MEELTNNVNWLAVTIGFVVAFVFGWLWYSPKLFGTKWATGVGLDDATQKMPLNAMITQGAGTFLLAWLVGITAASDALLTIILIVIAFIVLLTANGLFVGKSRQAIAIEAGFIFVMAIIMIVFQGVF